MRRRQNLQAGSQIARELIMGTRGAYNLDYRPRSYWDVSEAVFANIKGARRRQVIRAAVQSGTIDRLPPTLLSDSLPNSLRALLASMHPAFMGGEYLPDPLESEVEIVRVEMPTTVLHDVISIRARPVPEGISYRVVDDNGSTFACQPQASPIPLTFRELVELIDTAESFSGDATGLVAGIWDAQADDCGKPPEDRLETVVTSEFYTDLQRWYEDIADEWDRKRGVVAKTENDRPDPPTMAGIRKSLLASLAREERQQGRRRTEEEREALVTRWIAMRWS